MLSCLGILLPYVSSKALLLDRSYAFQELSCYYDDIFTYGRGNQ